MKFRTAVVAAASLFLLPLALADDADVDVDVDAESKPSPEETVKLAKITLPEFTPYQVTAPFFEQFTDGWESRWQPSNAKKEVKSGEEEWQFVGTWAVEEPIVFPGMQGDKGLVVKNEAAHHAISAKFPKVIDNKGKTLVVQYEVKLQDSLECGGAYMKLLKENKELHANEFSNASPYVIMFGPDKCGSTNKVHFIFKHKNPRTGEYEEKHLEDEVHAKIEKTTTLYTLIVNPDQSFQIKIDGREEAKGSLLENFAPSVNPPKEIDDPDDKKPEDWVENAMIDDPKASKPDDWDEDEPYEIEDAEATKPDDWLDNEPATIADPDAEKPSDWDDEEDGDWVAPTIPNPKCEAASGCGEWTKPMKKNPNYRGKWKAPLTENPDYKGVWAPRKMTNPDYYEDKTPADFEPMGAIGFELWTMQANILFDNIYIGHSIEDAEALQKATFDIKKPLEEKQEEALDEKEEKDKAKQFKDSVKPEPSTFKESPLLFIRQSVEAFIPLFKADPLSAVLEMPEVAGGLGVVLVTVIALVLGSLGIGAASPKVQEGAKKAKDKAVDAKDKAADGIASGVDKAQAELNKRTTRSNAGSE